MLKVYGAKWCPHCVDTEAHLKRKNIAFESIDMDQASQEVVDKIVQVNGGDDWVVPTLEFNGKFRAGKVYHPQELDQDLKRLGVMD